MTETMPSQVEEKLDFKRVFPIFVIVLVDLLGLTIIIPLLPLYTVAMGADPFVIGLLCATFPVIQLLGGLLLGGFPDRVGRIPIHITSLIRLFIGLVLLGFAITLPLVF